jgi:serine phosphatase RsbU (regulator of sigma subunit)
MITLQITPPIGAAHEEQLDRDQVRIGRSPENDLAIADPSVSRLHATIERTRDGFTIQDLGSRNGVMVNGQRIAGPTVITERDEVQLGDVILKLRSGPDVTLTDAPLGNQVDTTTIIAYEPSEDDAPLTLAGDSRPGTEALLAFFQEVTNAVIAARPFDDVLKEIVRQLLTVLPQADRACLFLIEGQPPEPRPRVALHRSGRETRMNVSRTIVNRVVDRLDSVLSLNAQQDNRFVGTESLVIQGTCSVMCVPLVGEGKAMGVLYVDTLSPFKQFDRDQLRLFSALGNIASGHIQRQRLLEEAILRRAYERELSQAAAIQRRLLAIEPVSRPGFAFFAANQPCLAVGGDYFDLIDCGERGVVLAIGDVCGKGMGAALLMSTLQATVRAEVRAGGGPLAIGRRVNAILYASTDPDKFVTLFLGHLDPKTGRLQYVNAGHDAPLLLRRDAKECLELAATGLVSGILPEAPLEEETIELAPGDLLYGYTDGLREAQAPDGDEFSAERLAAALIAHRALGTAEIAEKISDEVASFIAGGEPQDDMTQLLVRREAS